jgi:16S rRNA C1402 N4-methylase RsmH
VSRIDLVALAQQRVREVVEVGDTVIDATVGNGHDTLFLAQLIGDSGHLYGFDIQPAALAATRARLSQHHLLSRATLLQCGHETMAEAIPENLHGTITAVMFNLGYLPGNDHTVRTRSTTTRQALERARSLLAPNGIIVIIAYTGHAHGREETEEVKHWARGLEDEGYSVEIIIPPSRNGNAPELVVVRHSGHGTRNL